MFHRKLERQEAGKPIAARTLNRAIELLEWMANIRVAAPLAMSDTPMGPQIYLTTPQFEVAWGVTPSGGYTGGSISSPASNSTDVTLYPIPGNTTTTITASDTYSTYSTTIASGKTALYRLFPDGKWYIITADC